MDSNDICNDILSKAYKNYLDDIDSYKVEVPWDSYQSLYNKAINYLNENGLITIKARTIRFANVSLTPYGISCTAGL